MIEIYKTKNNLNPSFMRDVFTEKNNDHKLRSENHLQLPMAKTTTYGIENLQIPKYNLEYSKKRFSYTALKAWNEIPMNIRELPTLYQNKNS